MKLATCLFVVTLFFATIIRAQESLVNINPNRQVAIHGYDPVVYFTIGKATEGITTYKHEHHGAIWLFATEQHQKIFVNNPDKYTPQYGGYCP